jgi:glycosyltransferase involved in cell wall biosynthesis
VTHPELHNPVQRLQWWLLFPPNLRAADAVICVSNATRDALVTHYPEAARKAFTVHEAAPLAPTRPLVKRCTAGNYTLTVANVRPTKNVSILFNAILKLSSTNFTGNFVLAGADPYGQVSRFLAQHKETRLSWLESPSSDELKNLYRHAACYVSTSLTEGFCLPVLEAQSFGVPVVCSDLPVLREVAGAGALFFDPRDAQALANHIASLFANNDLAATLSGAALSNSSRFSWDQAATETVSIFERVLDGKLRGLSFPEPVSNTTDHRELCS